MNTATFCPIRAKHERKTALCGPMVFFFAISVCLSPAHAGIDRNAYGDEDRVLLRSAFEAAWAGAGAVYSYEPTPGANPANISFAQSNSAALSYASWHENALSCFMNSYGVRLSPSRGLGLSIGYVLVPDIKITDHFQLDEEGAFIYEPRMSSSSYVATRLAFGQWWAWNKDIRIAAGAALQLTRHRLINLSGYGIGMDGGISVLQSEWGLKFDVTAENVTSKYLHWNSEYQQIISPALRFGIGWSRPIRYLYGVVRAGYLSLDMLEDRAVEGFSVDYDERVTPRRYSASEDIIEYLLRGSIGLEYRIRERVALRVGSSAMNGLHAGNGTFGGAVFLYNGSLIIDLAYRLHELGGTYQAGASFHW